MDVPIPSASPSLDAWHGPGRLARMLFAPARGGCRQSHENLETDLRVADDWARRAGGAEVSDAVLLRAHLHEHGREFFLYRHDSLLRVDRDDRLRSDARVFSPPRTEQHAGEGD